MTDLNEVRSIRTADDSWAITESVGATALGVAALRAAETAQPDPLIRDEFALMLVSGAGAAWNQLAGSDLAWLRGDADARAAHEMARDYQAVRTHYFDGFFAEAVRSGIRQVVILAAGLDARAYRIDWPARTVVFELDQPKVLDYKAATLAAHGAVPTARRVAVPVDLRHDWPAVLTAAGFDPAQPTAWLAEGLLPYLPADAQDRLFELVTANSAAGSRIAVEAFTVEPAWNSAQQRAARRDRAQRMRARLDLNIDIDIDSLVYTDEQRADAAEWLAGHGWRVHAVPSVTEMTRLGRPAAGDLGSYGMDSVLLRAERTGGDQ